MAVSMHSAELVGVLLEGLAYGCLLTMFILVLLIQARCCRPWDIALFNCVLVWALTTVHFALDSIRVYGTFINADRSVHNIDNPSDPFTYVHIGIFWWMTLTCDAVLIIRAWVLYRGRRKVVVPAILGFVGNIVVLIGIIRIWAMVNVDKWTEEFQKWGICYFVLTFCTNLYSTLAIAWWCVSNGRRLTRRLRNHIVIPVFLVVVESGAIYSMGMFATIIARAASSNSMFTVLEFMPSLIGLSYMLIVLQLRLRAHPDILSFGTEGHQSSDHEVGNMSTRITETHSTHTAHLPPHPISEVISVILPGTVAKQDEVAEEQEARLGRPISRVASEL